MDDWAVCVDTLQRGCVDAKLGGLYDTWARLYKLDTNLYIFHNSLDAILRWRPESFETEAKYLLQQRPGLDVHLTAAFDTFAANRAKDKEKTRDVLDVALHEVLEPFLQSLIHEEVVRNGSYFKTPLHGGLQPDARFHICSCALNRAFDALAGKKIQLSLAIEPDIFPQDSASQAGSRHTSPKRPTSPKEPEPADISLISSHKSRSGVSKARSDVGPVRSSARSGSAGPSAVGSAVGSAARLAAGSTARSGSAARSAGSAARSAGSAARSAVSRHHSGARSVV